MPHGHSTPVEGCFGCHVSTLGFQGLRSRHGADPVHQQPVIADDGPRAGKTVGAKAEHWDGRTDATVFAPKLTIETKARET
jgi:hypothetical protein